MDDVNVFNDEFLWGEGDFIKYKIASRGSAGTLNPHRLIFLQDDWCNCIGISDISSLFQDQS